MNRIFCETMTGLRLVRLPVILPNPNIQYHNIKTAIELYLDPIEFSSHPPHPVAVISFFLVRIYAYISQMRYLYLEIKILCAFLIALKQKRALQWGILTIKINSVLAMGLVVPFFCQLRCMVLHFSIVGG
jgi:hypothetical protein